MRGVPRDIQERWIERSLQYSFKFCRERWSLFFLLEKQNSLSFLVQLFAFAPPPLSNFDFRPKKKNVFSFLTKQHKEEGIERDMSDESKDAARDERERFSQSTTRSRKKSTADAVVGVAAPITPLKKGEEERTRAFSFFFSSLSVF